MKFIPVRPCMKFWKTPWRRAVHNPPMPPAGAPDADAYERARCRSNSGRLHPAGKRQAMKILAIDTATRCCSVAVQVDSNQRPNWQLCRGAHIPPT